MAKDKDHNFVSRGGMKLQHAVSAFGLILKDKICADLGCSTGGFTDCMLQHGATRVYAVDTGYGVLDYKLRKDPRVVVKERTNAMHLDLPEQVHVVTIDASWTRQHFLLPVAKRILLPGGMVVTLVKPHYEAEKAVLNKGVLSEELLPQVLADTKTRVEALGFEIQHEIESPITGTHGNREWLWVLTTKMDLESSKSV